MTTVSSHAIKTYLWSLQSNICDALTELDGGGVFQLDPWTNPLGTGQSCILEQGLCFEKAGVNVSHVSGLTLPQAASQHRPELAGLPFEALGLSLVIHPHNPFVPTTHANVRYFIANPETQHATWWVGGGMDLTPYYGFKEDCVYWHTVCKQACDPFGAHLYPRFKAWCDAYFYLPHRQEARGIGGLFFDDFNELDAARSFDFMQHVGNHFLPAYIPIVKKRASHPYSEKEKRFQCYRRGRYVEFNLLYDRGTLFGLQSGGRTESILMSLPPTVNWHYQWQPIPGSPEARLYTEFLPIRNWLDSTSSTATSHK